MGKKRKAVSPLQPGPTSAGAVARTSGSSDQHGSQLRELHQQLTALQCRVEELELKHDSLEQRTRLPCLIFSGPAIPESGSSDEILRLIKGVISDKVGYQLDASRVLSSFRLRSGGLFVEFMSASPGSDRDVIFRSKTRLRGTGLFVSESLTRRRQGVFKALLQMKKSKEIHALYTQSGDIFVRMSSNSSPLKITNMTAVQQLGQMESPSPSQGHVQKVQQESTGLMGDVTETTGCAASRAFSARPDSPPRRSWPGAAAAERGCPAAG